MKTALLPAAIGAAILAGCGGEDGADRTTDMSSSAKPAPTTTIAISNYLYKPDPAVVKAGIEVAITNADRAPHTVTDKGTARAFDSGTIKGKRDGTVKFSKTGTFTYFCEFHPTMSGKVTVTE